MNRYLLLIVILIGFKSVRCKTVKLEYYKIINEAELLICERKYQSAIKHYTKAFKLCKLPFSKDIYNAWVCSILTKDKIGIRKYSLILKGRRMFKNNIKSILFEIDSLNGESNLLLWNSLNPERESSSKIYLRRQIDSLMAVDQSVRKFCIETISIDYNEACRDTLNYIDSMNTLRLGELFKENNNVQEQTIGSIFDNSINFSPFNIILSHDRSWSNRNQLDSTLYNNIFDLKFHPLEYASLKDYSFATFKDSISSYPKGISNNYSSDILMILNEKLYILKVKNKKEVDSNRIKIGLETIDEFCAKARFQYSNKIFKLIYTELFGVYNDLPELYQTKIINLSLKDNETLTAGQLLSKRCKYHLTH